MKISAHKVVGDVGKPGQLSFDRHPYLKHSTADQTLADYLTRKKRYEALDTLQPLTEAPKKLTFKEWLKKSSFIEPDETMYCWLEDCWKAAQENAPSYRPGAKEKT